MLDDHMPSRRIAPIQRNSLCFPVVFTTGLQEEARSR